MIRAGVAHLRRAHQRRRRRPRRLGRAGRPARPASAAPARTARTAPPADKLVVFVPGRARRGSDRRARRGRRRRDRRLRPLRLDGRGHRHVPPARRCAARRSGAVGEIEVVPRGAGRDGGAAPAAAPRSSPPCAPRTRTRSRPSTCWPRRRCRPVAAPDGSASCPRPMSLREFTAHAAARAARHGLGRARGRRPRPQLVRTVAVCGGSGGSLAERRPRGRRRRPTHRRPQAPPGGRGGQRTRTDAMALVDAAHWATEAPWLDDAGRAAGRPLRHYGGGRSLAAGHRSVDAARAVDPDPADPGSGLS